jgi:hypothetical protein
MSPRRASEVFGSLVEAPDDFVGLVAYGIYKRRKIDFIQAYSARNGGEPNDDVLDNFHAACVQNIPGYRVEASEIIQKFLQEYSDQDVEAYKAQLATEHTMRLSNLEAEFNGKLERLRPSALASVIHGALGSFVFTIAIGVVVVIILGLRVGAGGILQEFIRMLSPLTLPPS